MSVSEVLRDKLVAVPEGRQLDTLVELLKNRGARVLKIPLVAIQDAPDPGPILVWIERFVREPPDLFILLTGEGLSRLLDLAGRHELRDSFVAALGHSHKLCRGPKPERVLRTLGMRADVQAQEPTTAGIIATLASYDLNSKRVAVQLYGDEPNLPLVDFLRGKGANVDTVSPYIYASKDDEIKVVEFILALQAGQVDAVTFTSQPQYRRLQDVARAHGLEQALNAGLKRTLLAAVGPLVAEQLRAAGFEVEVMPDKTWFMKPLVTALMRHFERAPGTPL